MKNLLYVTVVKPQGQGKTLGIQKGDILVSYNGLPLITNDDLAKAIAKAKSEEQEVNELIIHREDLPLTFTVRSDESLGLTCESLPVTENLKNKSERSILNNTEYGTGKSMANFISFIGWAVFAIGVVMGLFALMASRGSFMAAIPLIAFALSGLFLIMGAQVTKATLDNADHSREILRILIKKDDS